jgi:hypothetical protein
MIITTTDNDRSSAGIDFSGEGNSTIPEVDKMRQRTKCVNGKKKNE